MGVGLPVGVAAGPKVDPGACVPRGQVGSSCIVGRIVGGGASNQVGRSIVEGIVLSAGSVDGGHIGSGVVGGRGRAE